MHPSNIVIILVLAIGTMVTRSIGYAFGNDPLSGMSIPATVKCIGSQPAMIITINR